MCGICGFTGATTADASILKAMCDSMAHRGPDGEGCYLTSHIALGHRRLSLIDLAGGFQPMLRCGTGKKATITSAASEQVNSPSPTAAPHTTESSPSSLTVDGAMPSPKTSEGTPQKSTDALIKGDYAIVFNGEIYNYQQLRSELEGAGWVFETNSDTEVLLSGYVAWKEAVLDRIRGMFAFAIWDNKKQQLFCARDFFGIKPFYYTVQNNQFIFASEIKSILEHPAYHRVLNEEALEHYLCFQFSALDETFFKGIFKLPPAHYMTVNLDGTTELKRYWSASFEPDTTRSRTDTVQAIDTAIKESVRYHNVADVEVGSFLSSGIDSSYLAATLAQENPTIKTFTVGFSQYSGQRDEISWAQELASEMGVENNAKHISEDEYWDSLAQVQWHMDEPSADPSAIALYFVDQEASKKVKAVLSGEGADELFGGYRIYQAPFANARLSWLPKIVLRTAARLARALGIRGANYLKRASETVEDWYYTNANGVAFSVEERKRLLKRPCRVCTPSHLVAPTYAKASTYDETTKMQFVDMNFWLIDDILLKTDKMAMAHSLESRVPFLDKEVFNLARTLPTSLKVDATQTKLALREAAEGAIPSAWAQKEKLGFPVPLVDWLRLDRHYNQVRNCFTSQLAETLFNTAELVKLLEEHRIGSDHSRKIWIVYMFLIWYKIYFVDKCRPSGKL